MKLKLSIGVKVMFLIATVALLITASLIIIAVKTLTPRLQDEIVGTLSNNALHTLDKIDRFLFERLSDIRTLTSEQNFVLVGNLHSNKEKLEHLIDFQDKKNVYGSISMYDVEGTKILDTRGLLVGKNEKDKDFFKEAIAGRYFSDPTPVLSESIGSPVIHFSGPLKDEKGDIVGVVVTRLPINKIDEIMKDLSDPEGLFQFSPAQINVDLVDSEGVLLFSNHDRKGVLQKNVRHLEIFEKLKQNSKRLETTIEHDTNVGQRNSELLYVGVQENGFLDYEGNGWMLLVGIDSADAFSTVASLTTRFALIGFIILIVIVFSSYFLSQSISTPIKKLRNSALEIAKGNLNYENTIMTDDEVGELSQAFNQMTSELRTSKKEIEKHSSELEAEIKERTKQLHDKIHEAQISKKASLNILEDVDESNKRLMEAQEKLTGYVAKLEQLDVQKDQFISIAAHELKTPLTSIKGFADLLAKKEIAENSKLRDNYLKIIFKDTARLSELISNILELSRMDIGTLKLAWETIKVSDLVEDVKEQMGIIIKKKNLKSTFIVAPGLPAITIDRQRTVQIISNLINNAVHYTDKGSITVDAKKQGAYFLFSVSDTGSGIATDQLEKIFERFYQVDNPLTRKIGGTGLGLSLCEGFVEAMGGKIWVKSKVGKGSTFYFTIPLKKEGEREEIKLFKEFGKGGLEPIDTATKKKIVEKYKILKQKKDAAARMSQKKSEKATKGKKTV